MTPDAWITVIVLVAAFGVLATDRMAPSAVVLTAAVVLLLTNVISTEQALAGFSNPAPITVAALYVLARAAEKTSLLTPLAARLLGAGRTRMDLFRLLGPTAAASSVLNNTPLVAMLTPDIVALSQRRNLSASRFLMPLSFAAILGGTITVLGTSTNLVVSGLLETAGGEPFGLFEITPVGLPAAVVGMVVLIVFAWRLVPDRATIQEQAVEDAREFAVTMDVEPGGPLDGMPVGETDLLGRRHVFLAQVVRDNHVFSPVDLDLVLAGGDRLVFAGEVREIAGLYRLPGLSSPVHRHLDSMAQPTHGLALAVVGRTSPLAGHTLADVGFLQRYQAVVMAIHRDGHRVTQDPRELRFRVGDTLLVVADDQFRANWSERRDFLLIAPLDADPPHMSRRAPFVAAITVAMVAMAALGLASIMEASLLAAGALVATRTLTANEVRDAIDFDVIILIASSFALGAAVEVTGLAALISDGVIGAFDGFGTAGVVFGLLLAVTLLTELVTNNAAVVVVFPIAMTVAASTGLDPRIIAMAIAVAASCSFLTPIGYQTNTIVYGPGGYRFFDYARVGLPLNLAVIGVVTAVVMAA
ncbi:MAG TPA: SLC13 family permease [Nitriliruptoraceae bacterium]|nr:SLC13 family permease [Nitriliruptoraceae bacterium]